MVYCGVYSSVLKVKMAQPFAMLRRSLCTSPNIAIKHVTVIGGGLMGSGIAQVILQKSTRVTIRTGLFRENTQLKKHMITPIYNTHKTNE